MWSIFLRGFVKGNSWIRLCWDSGFLGSWKGGLPLRFKSPAFKPRGQGRTPEPPGPGARTAKRVSKQCPLFEVSLAPGAPLCGIDQKHFLIWFLKKEIIDLVSVGMSGCWKEGLPRRFRGPAFRPRGQAIGFKLASNEPLTPKSLKKSRILGTVCL